MKKKDVISIAETYGLAPNKRLGQNFLVDDGITEKIIGIISPSRDDAVLEIGPGLGALTGMLLERSCSVTAVEIDAGLYRYLREAFTGRENLELLHCDFLKCETEDRYTRVVSNLPYYCASEILFKIASTLGAKGVYVMLQREMAQRITAAPGSPDYGALTVTLGYYYRSRIALQVPREVFYPRPDVGSSFMALERREDNPLSPEENVLFHSVVKSAFWGRRKTILKALSESPHLSFEKDRIRSALEKTGIEAVSRGEELSTEEYCSLTRELAGLID